MGNCVHTIFILYTGGTALFIYKKYYKNSNYLLSLLTQKLNQLQYTIRMYALNKILSKLQFIICMHFSLRSANAHFSLLFISDYFPHH